MDGPYSIDKEQHWLHVAFYLPRFLRPGLSGHFHWDDCCLVSGLYPSISKFRHQLRYWKEVLVIADLLLKFHADFSRCCFWSSARSLGTNFAAVRLMFSSADIMRLHVPYDNPTMLQASWIIHPRSSRITSSTFATFSAIVPIEVRPERWSSSSDVRPFLNRLNHLQICGWAKASSPNVFYFFLFLEFLPHTCQVLNKTWCEHAAPSRPQFQRKKKPKQYKHQKPRRSKECVHSALPGTTCPY